MKNYDGFSDDQFAFIIRKLWVDKVELLNWAMRQGKDELATKLEKEINILKGAERRLEQRPKCPPNT